MPSRDDENLDVVAGLSANRDDVPFSRKPKPGATPAQPRDGSEKIAGAGKPKSGGGQSVLVTVILLALIAACGWLGWQTYQMQQQLAKAEGEITVARKHLDILGAKLSQTGDSFSETETVYDKQFKLWESEIRKLWVIANERNKKAIEANRAGLKNISSSVKKAVEVGNASQKSSKAVTTKIERLSGDLNVENTVLKAGLEDQGEQLMLLRGELELLQKRLGNMPNDLAQRVKSNEEAVQAIDGARRQLVSSVTQLQKRLNELQLSIDGGSPLP